MITEWDLHEAMKGRDLPGNAKHLLRIIRMRQFLDGSGKPCWPSYQTIADDIGSSRSTAIRAVNWCEANGWLIVTKRADAAGDSDSNEYQVAIPALAPPDTTPSVTVTPPLVSDWNHRGVTVTPKEGKEEGTEEVSQTPKAQNAEKTGLSAPDDLPPVRAYLNTEKCVPSAPYWVLDHCERNGIDDAELFWNSFVCAEINGRGRFLTVSDWRGIDSRRAFFGWAETSTGKASAREASEAY